MLGYAFDYERHTAQTIKALVPNVTSVAIGRSIFGRKRLRKVKYGKIFEALMQSMREQGTSDVVAFVKKLLREHLFEMPDFELLWDSYITNPFVKNTFAAVQDMIDTKAAFSDFLLSWHLGDAMEDFTRILRTLGTGIVEDTKFAKMLETRLRDVTLTPDSHLKYVENGAIVSVDLSPFIQQEGREIRFRDGVTRETFLNTTLLSQKARQALAEVFDHSQCFYQNLLSPIPDFRSLPEVERLKNLFNVIPTQETVIGSHLLVSPVSQDLKEQRMLVVGHYPFGSLAADFVAGATKMGFFVNLFNPLVITKVVESNKTQVGTIVPVIWAWLATN